MRLEVSKKVDIAIEAMHRMKRDGRSDGRTLAEQVGTTVHFLPRVLQPLVGSGWIASIPGPGGGYELRADLNDISVLDVIDAVDGGMEMQRCVLRGAPCPSIEKCALHVSWQRARSALLAELDAMTVESAMASGPSEGA